MGSIPLLILFTLLPLLFVSASSTPSSFAVPTLATTGTDSPRRYSKIFAFGDSFTDTGNTVSTTGPSGYDFVSSLPYGITFFHHPTNRYSDGRLVIDFVAQSLALPFVPPYKTVAAAAGHNNDPDSLTKASSHGINFAVAGATAIPHSFFAKNNMTFDITPQSIGSQFNWFNKYLEDIGCGKGKNCDALFDGALFWVGEIGANDYAYSVGSSVPRNTVQNLAIGCISKFMEALLSRGAKNVVVQGLPPTGCLTLSLTVTSRDDRDSMGCVASANKQSYTHNTLLQTELATLRTKFPKANIIYADYWDAYTTILKNPGQFGFTEVFKACCGSGSGEYNYELFKACGSPGTSACSSPSQYINWDGVHLTEAMYKAVADMLIHGSSSRPPFHSLLA